MRISAIFFLSLCSILSAGENSDRSEIPEFLKPRVSLNIAHEPKTDFRKHDARFSVSKAGIRLSYLGIYLNYEGERYSWEDADNLVFNDAADAPWNKLHSMSAGMRYFRRLSDDDSNNPWMLVGGIRLGASFEKQLSRAQNAGFDISVVRVLDDQLSVGVGIGGSHNPIRNRVIPAISLRYGDEDRIGWTAALGYPTVISYRFTDSLRASGALGMGGVIYRLKDDSPVAEKGYYRQTALKPEIGLDYMPFEKLHLSLKSFYYFDRQWRIYDRRGSRIDSVRPDNNFGMAISAGWRF